MQIRLLQQEDKLPIGFYCDPKFRRIKNFFDNKAQNWQKEGIGTTFVGEVVQDSEKHIIGFMTVSLGHIEIKEGSYKDIKFPVLLIGKLLIDEMYQKNEYGTSFVKVALALANKIRNDIACRYVLVHSHFDAVKFYEKLFFKEVERDKNTASMIFDLHKSES